MDDLIFLVCRKQRRIFCKMINILTPLILEGIKSIFESSKKLCIQNNEYDKYLMTFQIYFLEL